MSELAVRVQDLGKRYFIGAEQARRKTFRDQLGDALIAPFRRAGKLLRGHATGAAERIASEVLRVTEAVNGHRESAVEL